MDRLNALYARLLGLGVLSIREALGTGDLQWAKAEVEFLHNVPSLIGESNSKPFFVKCQRYLKWTNSSGQEIVQRRLRVYYEPVWREIEPAVLKLVSDQPPVVPVSVESGPKADSGVVFG